MISLFLLSILIRSPADLAAEKVLVGVSKTVITPKIGPYEPPVWIAGYGNGRQATGVHDDLWARCMVISVGSESAGTERSRSRRSTVQDIPIERGNTQKTLALVSLDLVGYHYPEVVKIRKSFEKKYPDLKVDHILVASTHGHEGPDSIGLWGKTEQESGITPGYLDFVNSTVVEAIADAYKARKEARVRLGVKQARGYQGDGRIPIVKDEAAYFLHAEDTSGRPIGTLVDWSAHPETLGSRNTLITSDYPHYLREFLEKALGGTAVFFVGSIGGLLTTEGVTIIDPQTGRPAEEHSWRKAEVIGQGVGRAVLDGIKRSNPIPIDSLRIQSSVIYLPLNNIRFRLASGLHLMPRELFTHGAVDSSTEPGRNYSVPFEVPAGKEIQSEVNVITLGPAQILGIPGEIYPELVNGGIQKPQDPGADFPGAPREEPPLRSLMQGQYKFVFGLANDEVGYIIPKSQWDEKPPYAYGRKKPQYGEINSCGYDVAPVITSALRELLSARP
jgi:hypothetical protein